MRHRHGLLTLLAAGALMLAGGVASADAAAPPNDTFAAATAVSSLPFTDTVDTTQATTDADDVSAATACGVSSGSFTNSVWYSFTPSTDQTVQLVASGYSNVLAVVTGTPPTFSSAPVCTATTPALLQAVAGTTYYIGVAAFQNAGGSLTFSVSKAIPPAITAVAITGGTFDPHTGFATVNGTVTCSGDASFFVQVSLSQTNGHATIQGYGFLSPSPPCDDTTQTWSIQVLSFTGEKLKGGIALVAGDAQACKAPFGCVSASFPEQKIILKH